MQWLVTDENIMFSVVFCCCIIIVKFALFFIQKHYP